MTAERVIGSHLRLASDALGAAGALLDIGNRFAVYQAEQAVEQILLALALAEGLHISRSQHHQLDTMRRALPETNVFRTRLAELTWLEAYATTYRYPRPGGGISDPPDPGKLRRTITAIAGLLVDVTTHFGVDLDSGTNKPATHGRPPRPPGLLRETDE